jgi:hypothetical protein
MQKGVFFSRGEFCRQTPASEFDQGNSKTADPCAVARQGKVTATATGCHPNIQKGSADKSTLFRAPGRAFEVDRLVKPFSDALCTHSHACPVPMQSVPVAKRASLRSIATHDLDQAAGKGCRETRSAMNDEAVRRHRYRRQPPTSVFRFGNAIKNR